MSLKTNSFFKKNKVPLDTLTGIRITSARTVMGTKIFKLKVTKQNNKVIYEKAQDIKHISRDLGKGYESMITVQISDKYISIDNNMQTCRKIDTFTSYAYCCIMLFFMYSMNCIYVCAQPHSYKECYHENDMTLLKNERA